MDWLSELLPNGLVLLTVVRRIANGAIDDYVKELLKDGLKHTTAIAIGVDRHKRAAVKAIAIFVQLFEKEIAYSSAFRFETESLIDATSEFLANAWVRRLLVTPLTSGAKTVDCKMMASIWREMRLQDLPSEFDWESVCKQYLREIRSLVREDVEVRAIYDSLTLEATKQATEAIAGVQPGFDLLTYREAILHVYAYLNLNSVHPSAYEYRLLLWNVFVPQQIREFLPTEAPKAHASRSPIYQSELEAKQHRLDAYRAHGSRNVLEVLEDSNYLRSVILGDPGSGKSSLLQYLAIRWAEQRIARVPLLIELRKYTTDPTSPHNFLDFMHKGQSFICRLDQQELHALLSTGQAIAMFDGLDEVVSASRRETVINEIIRFATVEYPKAQVIVTTRVVGYSIHSHRFATSSFRELTIQDFADPEIETFVNKWHQLAIVDKTERSLLSERLLRSIEMSGALRDLVANPLLLTMVAILNRNQELPKDRADLYDQASRVLLQEWDINKFLPDDQQLPRDTVGRQEKQALLRNIAYHMQTSKAATPNLIRAEDLLDLIESYLVQLREIQRPHAMAKLIVQQLRERNFILCFSGENYYSFVHRTFLEYFCAFEIVWKFKEQRALSETELVRIYQEYWKDENWHEVLRLIVGMIAPQFAELIVNELLQQTDESGSANSTFLAVSCYTELRQHTIDRSLGEDLLRRLQALIMFNPPFGEEWSLPERRELREIRRTAVAWIAKAWRGNAAVYEYLLSLEWHWDWAVRYTCIEQLARNWSSNTEILKWLVRRAKTETHQAVGQTAVRELARIASQSSEIVAILSDIGLNADRIEVREAAHFEVERLNQPEKVRTRDEG